VAFLAFAQAPRLFFFLKSVFGDILIHALSPHNCSLLDPEAVEPVGCSDSHRDFFLPFRPYPTFFLLPTNPPCPRTVFGCNHILAFRPLPTTSNSRGDFPPPSHLPTQFPRVQHQIPNLPSFRHGPPSFSTVLG